jgi:hypothetical protein
MHQRTCGKYDPRRIGFLGIEEDRIGWRRKHEENSYPCLTVQRWYFDWLTFLCLVKQFTLPQLFLHEVYDGNPNTHSRVPTLYSELLMTNELLRK